MKIAQVCSYDMSKGGGVQEVVRALHSGLAARGHTSKIITPAPKDVEGLDTADMLFLGMMADFKSPMKTTTQITASVTNEDIDAILHTYDFDILHFHEPWQPVLSRQILSRSSSVNVATFHSKVPENLMSRTLIKVVVPYTKSVLRYIHDFTAVSPAAAEYISEMTADPITIIPNGIDLARYTWPTQRQVAAKAEPTILFIGRLEGRKGLKYLLRAFSLLTQENPRVSLVIAGDGPDREKLEELVRDLSLPRVKFLGYVSEAEKLNLLSKADLFCSPATFGESFGIVLLEAMATGLVTVAGDNAGYESVMKDLGAVSLVNTRDAPEFARRMSLMLRETKLRQLWQSWARAYVQQFDYPKVVTKYEEFYQGALTRHR